MRFLISVIDDQTGSATPEEMAAIDVFNEQLQAGGNWLLACGLSAPASATVIDGRGPNPVVTSGSLHDSADYISGFWLVTAPDLETARALAVRGSAACNRRVELRPLLGD